MNNTQAELREKIARTICEAEGFDPDEPVEIHDEVGDDTHQPMWMDYEKQARAVQALLPPAPAVVEVDFDELRETLRKMFYFGVHYENAELAAGEAVSVFRKALAALEGGVHET